LELNGDGAFEFTTSVQDGAGFEVTVETQPAGPDQGCSVANGSGAIAGADVTDVEVRCVTPIRHVVVFGVDGMGGQFTGGPATPNLDALVEESAWTLNAQSALPTMSSTNWMSMINGSTPDQHGVLSNGWQPGDSAPQETMFQSLRTAQPDAKIGIFHDWADFGRLVESGAADVSTHPGDEVQTMDAALDWLQQESPDLLFVHLDIVDHEGHFNTWGSTAYDSAIEQVDGMLGNLRTVLETTGMWPYTAVIVSADHGGAGFSHGADTPAERAIPFVLRTPQGGTGPVLRETRIWDVAPTVLALLGVEAPTVWSGRRVMEGFDPSERPPAPSGDLVYTLADTYEWIWDDAGTGAFSDVSLWRADEPDGFRRVGDVVVTGHAAPGGGTLMVRSDDPLALAAPVAFEQVWSSAGANGDADVTLWNPIPPLGYVCLGTVATAGIGVPPPFGDVACVHSELLISAPNQFVWDDTGSGAGWDGSVWGCVADTETTLVPRAFITRRHHDGPGLNKCFGLDPARAVSD
jgi:hypothetical protein